MGTRVGRWGVVVGAASLLLTGCGESTGSESTGAAPSAPTYQPSVESGPVFPVQDCGELPETMPVRTPASCGEVRGYASLVIDSGSGPELCLGMVAMSSPPGCSGLPLVGWDWDMAPHGEQEGIRYTDGGVWVTGTFDGEAFTITSARSGDDPDLEIWPEYANALNEDSGEDGDAYDDEGDFTSPCADPQGGWKVPGAQHDPYGEEWQEAFEAAGQVPGFVDHWVDDRTSYEGFDGDDEMPDSAFLIIHNVVTTGDVAATEAAIRAHYDGPICVSVSGVTVTPDELAAARDVVEELPGMASASTDDRNGYVQIEVANDDGSLQAWCDAEFGKGVVRVQSALIPLAPA